MGVSTRKPWLTSLGVVLAGVTLCAGVARAELALSTDTPGSIAVFPKVIADEARDTIIMLTNTSNMPLSVHCWYFDANNACQPADFYVDLTSRQPTWWRVSTGRDSVDEPNVFHGSVPARVNFQGELKCVEIEGVNLSPFPVVRNALKGEATLVTKSDGQTSAYNAIMFQGGDGAVSLCQGGARDGLSCDPRDQEPVLRGERPELRRTVPDAVAARWDTLCPLPGQRAGDSLLAGRPGLHQRVKPSPGNSPWCRVPKTSMTFRRTRIARKWWRSCASS